jgi:hypothetical protein
LRQSAAVMRQMARQLAHRKLLAHNGFRACPDAPNFRAPVQVSVSS